MSYDQMDLEDFHSEKQSVGENPFSQVHEEWT
jgi:hypothetical protein